MDHWAYTQEMKDVAGSVRRRADRSEVEAQMDEFEEDGD
jgi:hypothetical protein